MKRNFIMFVLLTTAAYIFAQNPSAVIKEMTGTVELKKSGSSVWVKARTGEKIEKSTIISTGFKSTAVLEAGNSTFTVRPLTRLSLEELTGRNDSETVTVNLDTGRIKADVKPPSGSKSNVTVQAPAASASVRGTSFEMDTVSIKVQTGAISYTSSSGRPVMVGAGQSSWVNVDTGAAVTPMAAAESSGSLSGMSGETWNTGRNGAKNNSGLQSGDLGIEIILKPQENK